MKSIVCPCENVFEAELPDVVDLDADEARFRSLSEGTFMSARCPACGMIVKTEFPVRVLWTSKNLAFKVVPEAERTDFLRGSGNGVKSEEVLIGYPELAERVSVIAAGLEPVAVEALKYYLLVKAEESAPDAEASVWFFCIAGDSMEFHLFGLRPSEVAVSRIPLKVYEKTLADYRAHPESEPFRSLRVGPYLSVQNLLRAEDGE
ncbi:MAG: hypothetical protein A2Y36_11290 [Treponema sp. GWA1_62_8]|nr:MAG: hypothetical protein A2Y36_11290 [Treponema sp. GWA1_62_8]